MSDAKFWSNRYEKEGQIWLQQPSLTALFVEKAVPKNAAVLETGFGYGRDLVYLIEKGYEVTGIELSEIGVEMAKIQLDKIHPKAKSELMQGNFLNTAFSQQFDAAYSHRVLHLFDDQQVQHYVDKLAQLIRPKGRIFISARDARGVKPNRKGHKVSFWEAERFRSYFSKAFQIHAFERGEEIESASNPVSTYFTLMIAERKLEY